jgi:hypothetical protein
MPDGPTNGGGLAVRAPYPRLTGFLLGLSERHRRIAISFRFLQELAGEELPVEAMLPSWWTNDAHQPQSAAWLAAGWRIEKVAPVGGVAFVRAVP